MNHLFDFEDYLGEQKAFFIHKSNGFKNLNEGAEVCRLQNGAKWECYKKINGKVIQTVKDGKPTKDGKTIPPAKGAQGAQGKNPPKSGK